MLSYSSTLAEEQLYPVRKGKKNRPPELLKESSEREEPEAIR